MERTSVIDIHYRSSNLTVKLLCEPPKWSPTDIFVSLQHVNISVRVPKFVFCKSVSHQWQQKSVKGLKFPNNFKSTMRNKWTSLYKQKTLLDQFFTTSEVGFCWHPNHHRPNKQCTKYTAWERAPALVAFYNNTAIYDVFSRWNWAHIRLWLFYIDGIGFGGNSLGHNCTTSYVHIAQIQIRIPITGTDILP